MSDRFASIALLAMLSPLATAGAQGVPTTQPGLINIVIEEVKMGRNAEHARNEAGWPAAYEKAKSPYNYVALVSVTGRTEAWYVATYKDHAAYADGMKREDANPVLSAELARLSKADAEFVSGLRVVQARGRPDLSYGAFPNIAMQRFWEITWYRVRPGHEDGFEAAAKAYGAMARRSAPAVSYRVYEVLAGNPGPTYLVFSTVEGFGDFDKLMAAGDATMKGATKDEMATFTKFFQEGLINSETQRFRLDPGQSYVTKATRDQDPAFWSPKKAAAKPAGQP
jgi:hypothetical protein